MIHHSSGRMLAVEPADEATAAVLAATCCISGFASGWQLPFPCSESTNAKAGSGRPVPGAFRIDLSGGSLLRCDTSCCCARFGVDFRLRSPR